MRVKWKNQLISWKLTHVGVSLKYGGTEREHLISRNNHGRVPGLYLLVLIVVKKQAILYGTYLQSCHPLFSEIIVRIFKVVLIFIKRYGSYKIFVIFIVSVGQVVVLISGRKVKYSLFSLTIFNFKNQPTVEILSAAIQNGDLS